MHATGDRLLTTKEVATVFRVHARTINRWARSGLIKAITTPGGRLRRYRESDVKAALLSNGEAA